ncbi:MAG: hypothetical protein ACRD2H_09600 [Terriglobales bacterium]
MNTNDFIKNLPGVLCYLYSQAEKDSSRFLAHCLDFNIMASGPSRQDAARKLDLMVSAYVFCAFVRDDLAAIRQRKATDVYWTRFYDNKPRPAGTLRVALTDEVSRLLCKQAAAEEHHLDLDPSTREQFRRLNVRKLGAAA